MMRAEIIILILIVVSAGCIGSPAENTSDAPQPNDSPTQNSTEVNGSEASSEEGQIATVRFSETDEEPAERASVVEYGELESDEKILFENAVGSGDNMRVTNNTTRTFANFLDELSQPRTRGLGEEAIDPDVYIERNGTVYRVEIEREGTSP
jgi:hypothetical protein